jgi:microcompartment protein CcmK/EutM
MPFALRSGIDAGITRRLLSSWPIGAALYLSCLLRCRIQVLATHAMAVIWRLYAGFTTHVLIAGGQAGRQCLAYPARLVEPAVQVGWPCCFGGFAGSGPNPHSVQSRSNSLPTVVAARAVRSFHGTRLMAQPPGQRHAQRGAGSHVVGADAVGWGWFSIDAGASARV